MSWHWKPADFSWRYQVLFPLLAQLPPRLSYPLAAGYSRLARARHQGGLATIEHYLRQTFPEATEQQLQLWLYSYSKMLEQEALDSWYIRRPVIQKQVTLQGFEAIAKARAAGQSVILTSGHFGRFWLAGAAIRAEGQRVATITRDGRETNEHHLHPAEHRYRLWKLQQLQKSLGGPFLIEGDDLRPLYHALNECIVTLIFDVPYTKNLRGGVTVPFLSGNIMLPAGIYKMAKTTKSVIAPFFMRDLGNGGVVAEFSALLHPEKYNKEECMSLLASQLEARIRARPDQWWLWAALPLLQREQ